MPIAYFGLFSQSLVGKKLILVAALSFLIATYLFSPDLDLKYSRPTKNWGILKFIWFGYHRLFRHRGASHSLLLSSITKVLYLTFLGALFYAGTLFLYQWILEDELSTAWNIYRKDLNQTLQHGVEQMTLNKDYLIAALGGLMLSDWMHIVTDRLFSTYRRLKSK